MSDRELVRTLRRALDVRNNGMPPQHNERLADRLASILIEAGYSKTSAHDLKDINRKLDVLIARAADPSGD